MITKEQQARLFVFTVVGLGLLILFAALLIVPQLKARGVPFFINFKETSVNGLLVGAPVKFQGVELGKVRRIRVLPDDLSSIRVELEIEKSFPVRSDMTATMTYAGITGSKFIELSGGTNASPRLAPGGEIQPSRGLGEKAEDIVANIDTAVRRINNLLGDENQKRISLFLENTEKSAAVISGVLEAKRENLSNAITNIEKAALDFGAVTENLRRISGDLGGMTSKLNEGTGQVLDNFNKRFSDEELGKLLKNLQAFVESGAADMKKLEELLLAQQTDLRTTVESMSAAVDNLSKFSRALVEDPMLFLRSRKVKK
ncbi:MAG: MlaD family protein [Candidatus Aminicenantes bacterium]|nr:MlaD family protein [Candidatus Aminicenantes bacterium]